MRCAPGIHQIVATMLQGLQIVRGPVLDLGSGSGALLARLGDEGFTDLNAVELNAQKFGLAGVVPIAIDLNSRFAASFSRRFSLITCVEIIEHLDSPRNFLTEVRELLADDGLLLLTTPNVADWMGRIRFLLTGTLRYFDDAQYRFNHHVSPLPNVQLRHLLDEIGLRIITTKTAGTFFGPLKMALLAPFWLPFRLFAGDSVMGDVNLYALVRTEPKPSRAGDWTEEISDATVQSAAFK
ncbi:MAG: class I SAM-dependent methyltransferase [Planctomycetota bacterium]|nr:class I SAM-dependent methyltransferase [Planctomycetota bacterium]